MRRNALNAQSEFERLASLMPSTAMEILMEYGSFMAIMDISRKEHLAKLDALREELDFNSSDYVVIVMRTGLERHEDD